MKRKFSQDDYPYCFIITIPKELLLNISWRLDDKSQSTLARTCTVLNSFNKKHFKKETYTWVSNMEYDDNRNDEYIRKSEQLMDQIGWVTVKTILKTALVSPHNSYTHSVRGLRLMSTSHLPIGINPADLNAFVMEFNFNERHLLNLSLFKTFENLMLLKLSNITFESDKMSEDFELRLEAIYLHSCEWTDDDASMLFKRCTNLQETQLSCCRYSGNGSVEFPPSLKRLALKEIYEASEQISISGCTQLESLEFDYFLKDPNCFGNLLSNLKTLILHPDSIRYYEASASSLDNDNNTIYLEISMFKSLKELQVHGTEFIGGRLNFELHKEIDSFSIKLFSCCDGNHPTIFEFEFSPKVSRQVSIPLGPLRPPMSENY